MQPSPLPLPAPAPTPAWRVWLTPWRLLPAYALNGMAVAVGIGCIQLLALWLAGAHAASLVVSGAVCATIADLPNPLARSWRRVGAAALLAAATTLLVSALRPHPLALGGTVLMVSFVAMMCLAWGARAGAVSMAPLLAMVFAMAVPPTGHPLAHAAHSACGSAAFVLWALLANGLLQRRYRTLALAQALRAAAELFQRRAAVLVDGRHAAAGGPMQAWISGESALADRLQSARDMLFVAPPSPRQQCQVGVLLRVIDLRDLLLASRLDADLLGHDAQGRALLQRLAQALRGIGDALEAAARHVQRGTLPAHAPTGRSPRGRTADQAAAPGSHPTVDQNVDQTADQAANQTDRQAADQTADHTADQIAFHTDTLHRAAQLHASDARARLLPAVASRLAQLHANVQRIHALLRGQPETLPLTHAQLQRFVGPEGWPLRALRTQWTLNAPVLRHAVRMSLALTTAYFMALALPWGAHPYWLILSVAVVLRGNLGDTLARRNARVLGTLLGCLLVVALLRVPSPALLGGVFLVAVGTAHAFALQRYWLTATAASVMALMQAHLVNPTGGLAIAERVADTFLGVLIAWCFSYVLPSWERRGVAASIARVLRALQAYAAQALKASAQGPRDVVEERMARRQAYDALSALAIALQRSRAEPRVVRLPARQIATLLDHGERLMAHVSMVRLLLARWPAPAAHQASSDAAFDDGGSAIATALARTAADLQLRLEPGTGAGAGASAGASAGANADAPPNDTQLAAGTSTTSATTLDTLPGPNEPFKVLPWLLRRLALMSDEARHVQAAAAAATTAAALARPHSDCGSAPQQQSGGSA